MSKVTSFVMSSLLVFVGSGLFAESVKIPAPVKKAFEKTFPNLKAEDHSWHNPYYVESEFATDVSFGNASATITINKNGKVLSLRKDLKSDAMSGSIPEDIVEKAATAIGSSPDSAVIDYDINSKKVKTYSFYSEHEAYVAEVKFGPNGKQIGKVRKHGKGG